MRGLAFFLIPAMTFAAPIPRETSGALLERLFGKPDEKARNCDFKLEKNILEIAVPGEVDASAVTLGGAPRTIKSVRGDFTAEVNVSYIVPKDPMGGHCGAGIAIWTSEKEYALINRHHWPGGNQNGWSGGFDTHMHAEGVPAVSHGATCPETAANVPGRLRIKREKNEITSAYTLDGGKTWHETGKLIANWPDTIQIGVAAFNTTKKPMRAIFETMEIRN